MSTKRFSSIHSRNQFQPSKSNDGNTEEIGPRDREKYIEEFNFPFCDDASKYERVAKIGQGTFG